jgi:hypothetical protein
MRWRNTETPTFAGSNNNGNAGPDVVEVLDLLDRNDSVVATFTKSVSGALSLAMNGAVQQTGLVAYKSADTARDADSATNQTETATIGGGPVVAEAELIVTANGMTNSPKTVKFSIAHGDTAAQIATKARAALTADANVGHPSTGFFTVSGATTAIILTAKTKAANDGTMNIAVDNDTCGGITPAASSANTTAGVAAVLQVETAVVVEDVPGTLTAGNATVTVTAAGMGNSPKAVVVALAENDNEAAVAGKIRTALGLDADVIAFFTVSGTGANVVLTARTAAANDATMNIAIADTTSSGLTDDATSDNTTAGVLGVLQVETATIAGTGDVQCSIVVTAAGMTNSPKTISVTVAHSDTAAQVAGKVRAALALDEDVSDFFTVGGSSTAVSLTVLVDDDYDATMNIASDNDTCSGLTPAATSANTTSYEADPHLSVSVVEGTYMLEAQISLTTIDGGFKCDLSGGTAEADNALLEYTLFDSDGVAYDAARATALSGAGATVSNSDADDYVLQIRGSVEISAAGTLALRWAQTVPHESDTTVLRGGWIRLTKV